MYKMIFILLMLGIGIFPASAQENTESTELQTVTSVDLQRYSGKWFEIARYPNKFQKQCIGNTTATYVIKEDNKIEVINECLKKDGKTDRAKGKARVVDNETNAKLKVRFAPAFLSFLPFVWGDYWIIDLGEDYQYAVIGDPGRKYFWILSRTDELDDVTYQAILKRAGESGFDPARIVKTPQNVKSR